MWAGKPEKALCGLLRRVIRQARTFRILCLTSDAELALIRSKRLMLAAGPQPQSDNSQ